MPRSSRSSHDPAGQREDAPEGPADEAAEDQAEQEGKPGLEPPQPPSANQVRQEPFPASHHDDSRQEGLNPAEAEASDDDRPA